MILCYFILLFSIVPVLIFETVVDVIQMIVDQFDL